MATTAITMQMTAACGKPIAELERLIAERVRLINGETTESAVAATAINILKSVRSGTAKAKPDKAKFAFTLAERNDLIAGFKGREGRRVIRMRGGHELTGVKFVNCAGAYQKSEVVKVYIAIVRYGKRAVKGEAGVRHDRYYIISRSEETAAAYMEKKLRRRIELYAGMAKWVVGQAMRQVSAQMNGKTDQASDAVRAEAVKVGLKNLKVRCVKQGFGAGSASVYVLDGLDYALDALRGGSAALNTIYMKAANKTASIINHWVNHELRGMFGPQTVNPCPFPEVKGRR